MGRSKGGFCPRGHHISGSNTTRRIARGTIYNACRKCYQASRNKRYRLRYRNDPAFREKVLKKSRDYKRAKRKAQVLE